MLKRTLFYLFVIFVLPLQASDSLSIELVRRLDHLLTDSLLRHSQLGLCVYDLTDDTIYVVIYSRTYTLSPLSCDVPLFKLNKKAK